MIFDLLTMKKTACLILVLVLSFTEGIDVFAAQNKKKTFTKRYHNEKLIVVLNDLCRKNGYTLNIPDEIDENSLV